MAKNADDLPRELPREDSDEVLIGLLWQASAVLLGIVVLYASSRVFRTRTDLRADNRAKLHSTAYV